MSLDSQEPSKCASKVSIASLDREKRVYVYETETGEAGTFSTEILKRAGCSSIWKIPVPKWTTHVDFVLLSDKAIMKGPVTIASVPIPLSMALRRSIIGQERSIYAVSRV
ncbi:hypothetical protein O1611_g7301 [Lasiodiplodia mahajangana]|uniref:Uncharacterized protein n=1 Tax=Lasiodiplodia mahajangana TaxID=1108764 RepID=A0ACC2JFR3_9PEZI|nr:hypothetical protein O1611_g7301 [Lasiodiplodia mahajangana]